jgi:hypothetical protein
LEARQGTRNAFFAQKVQLSDMTGAATEATKMLVAKMAATGEMMRTTTHVNFDTTHSDLMEKRKRKMFCYQQQPAL